MRCFFLSFFSLFFIYLFIFLTVMSPWSLHVTDAISRVASPWNTNRLKNMRSTVTGWMAGVVLLQVLLMPDTKCRLSGLFWDSPSCICLQLTFTWWECCGLCLWHKPAELAHSFLFCSCVCFCFYGPFNCISFHKFSRRLFALSLGSSGFLSALLVLSTICLFLSKSP